MCLDPCHYAKPWSGDQFVSGSHAVRRVRECAGRSCALRFYAELPDVERHEVVKSECSSHADLDFSRSGWFVHWFSNWRMLVDAFCCTEDLRRSLSAIGLLHGLALPFQ